MRMWIKRLRLQNFRSFANSDFEFEQDFNLIVGVNGAGKTALLEALAVCAGAWLLGIRGQTPRNIRRKDIRVEESPAGNSRAILAEKIPVVVEGWGEILGADLHWKRSLHSPDGRATFVDARDVKELAESFDSRVRNGETVTLPIICYYGSGRLRQDVRQRERHAGSRDAHAKTHLMRLEAYRFSADGRIDQNEFVEYFARESWNAFQIGEFSPEFLIVRDALLQCVDGALRIEYNPHIEKVVVEIEDQGTVPFDYLSDGQQTTLAMFGDLCRKIVQLNPHLGQDAIRETPGVVLIDELDLHLHPGWQRRIVKDLQRAFPRIQFIATTHSPQVVGELNRRCIMLINHNGTWTRPWIGTRGADSGEILKHVMGSMNQDEKVADLDRRIDQAIDNENLSLAETLYRQFLEETEEPTLQRTRMQALIENERALQE